MDESEEVTDHRFDSSAQFQPEQRIVSNRVNSFDALENIPSSEEDIGDEEGI